MSEESQGMTREEAEAYWKENVRLITILLVISQTELPSWAWAITMILLAILMVSRIHYPDMKRFNIRKMSLWKVSLFIAIAIAVGLVNAKYLINLPLVIYVLYGITAWLFSRGRSIGGQSQRD